MSMIKNAKSKAVASTKEMEHAIKLVAKQFNLGDTYTLVEFKDGVNKCKVTLANEDFTVTTEIKNKMKYGFPSMVGDDEVEEDEELDDYEEDDEEEDEE